MRKGGWGIVFRVERWREDSWGLFKKGIRVKGS